MDIDYILRGPCGPKQTLPGEVCVVLIDQIFLDPEIIVASWEEHNLLMWGVVTIPKARCLKTNQKHSWL